MANHGIDIALDHALVTLQRGGGDVGGDVNIQPGLDPFADGFFDYMYETGLYEVYEAAYNHVAERVLENWQEDNGITINVA